MIVPLFALANAGVIIRASAFDAPGASRVTVGVVVGLVAGKAIGITAATWLAVRLRVGRATPGASWAGVAGVAAVAGIGFTVSLFVTGLAFPAGSPLEAAAKVGTVAASSLAAIIGATALRRLHAPERDP